MTRLQFLRSLGGLGLAAACVPVLAACKADDDDDGPTPDANNNMNNPDASMGNPADAGVDGSMQPKTCATLGTAVGENHGHAMTVSAADVTAGVDKTYQIQGTSTHPHTVVVTAASFATLKMTGSVTVTSSVDSAHSHDVTVTCTS